MPEHSLRKHENIAVLDCSVLVPGAKAAIAGLCRSQKAS